MDEETLMADIVSKLTQIGVYVDDDLPKYIVEKIRNNKSIDQIKEDIFLFLDSDTNVFVEWLNVYLNKIKNTSLNSSITEVNQTGKFSKNEIDEEILDFEENIEDDDENESINNQDNLNKRKNEYLEENSTKRLMNNEKKSIFIPSVNVDKEENLNIQNNIIKLTSSQRLNDIGKMRRKAIEEKLKLVTIHNDEEKNHSEENDKFSDLRMKLEKKRTTPKDSDSNQENEIDDKTKIDNENEEIKENPDDDKKEKCKFWPLCKKELDCIYYHPTVLCKQFPACKYGEKCFNIHPVCKFDAMCTKKDCPFTHITKKLLNPTTSSIQCKFYPNCLNLKCPFLHPRLCMYGNNCKNASCLFKHMETPSSVAKPHQLKWNSKKDNSNTNLEDTPEMQIIEEKSTETNSCLEDANKVVVIVKED